MGGVYWEFLTKGVSQSRLDCKEEMFWGAKSTRNVFFIHFMHFVKQ